MGIIIRISNGKVEMKGKFLKATGLVKVIFWQSRLFERCTNISSPN